jgi:hypothetical protein
MPFDPTDARPAALPATEALVEKLLHESIGWRENWEAVSGDPGIAPVPFVAEEMAARRRDFPDPYEGLVFERFGEPSANPAVDLIRDAIAVLEDVQSKSSAGREFGFEMAHLEGVIRCLERPMFGGIR